MNNTPIQNNLREYRLKANMRQTDVAEKLGLASADRISHWEKGQAYPSVPNLMKISKMFGICRVIYTRSLMMLKVLSEPVQLISVTYAHRLQTASSQTRQPSSASVLPPFNMDTKYSSCYF